MDPCIEGEAHDIENLICIFFFHFFTHEKKDYYKLTFVLKIEVWKKIVTIVYSYFHLVPTSGIQ